MNEIDIQEQLQDKEEKSSWRSFVINIFLILTLFLLGIYFGLFLNNKKLIESEIITRARAHFNNIVLTRRWNAIYGGVFVEKKDGMQSNPYLENPDIHTIDGKVYTKKNPALMTREISEIATKDVQYRFHITSLDPLNPDNSPDDFERESLQAFTRGEKERFATFKEDKKVFFRYMAPLFTEAPCLACHAKQGYKVGDIRGGISVKFDITQVNKALKTNTLVILFLFLLTTAVLISFISYLIWKLSKRLNEAMRKIRMLAVTDVLTGVFNRRYGLSKFEEELNRAKRYDRSFALLLMDIDHFKRINDTYGHQIGDRVLNLTASLLKKHIRDSDTLMRYGGEEFGLLLPEIKYEQAVMVANKLRSELQSTKIPLDEGQSVSITASFGATGVAAEALQGINKIDELIAVADKALYRAKEKGRNRVEWLSPV